MSNMYRGHAIDASYQALLHLAEGFQRRRLKCEKLTDDGHQVMAKTHIAFGKVSKKGCSRLAAASNKVYQLPARGRWFSPASFTTKISRHDIAEILLKVELKHQKSNQIKSGQVYRGNRRKIIEGISQVGYSFDSYHKYICRVALGSVDPIT